MENLLHTVTQDLKLASYSPRTVEAYSYHVKKFLEYFDKDLNPSLTFFIKNGQIFVCRVA